MDTFISGDNTLDANEFVRRTIAFSCTNVPFVSTLTRHTGNSFRLDSYRGGTTVTCPAKRSFACVDVNHEANLSVVGQGFFFVFVVSLVCLLRTAESKQHEEDQSLK